MSESRLLGGSDFFRRLTVFFGIMSTIAISLIAGYIYALMRLSAAEWAGFLRILAVAAPVLFIGTTLLNRPLHAPITRYLNASAKGQGTRADLRSAFRAVCDLPYRFFLSGLFWWTAAGLGVSALMAAEFETFGLFRVAVLSVAACSGGFVCSVFMFFGLKRLYLDVRSELGRRIGDPEERQALVRRIGVGTKLRWSVTGVTFVTVAFALLLAVVHVSRPLEANAVGIQQRFLESRAEALADPEEFFGVAQEALDFGIASHVLLVDPATFEIVAGDSEALLPAELAEISGARGDSLDFDSPHAFAWYSLGSAQPIAVAVQSWVVIAPSATDGWIRFGITLILSGLIALGLAQELAQDIGATTRELGEHAGRVASGDLRPSDGFESEDELGELSRSFERMSGALRATVGRVSEAADRVEGNRNRDGHGLL